MILNSCRVIVIAKLLRDYSVAETFITKRHVGLEIFEDKVKYSKLLKVLL